MDILKYLGLPPDYQPNPESDPIRFLSQNIRTIPKHFAQTFAQSTTPKQRTVLPVIRNRRTKFTQSNPTQLSFESAKKAWPLLWTGDPSDGGPRRGGQAEGLEEKNWADREFLGGAEQHVGKLGTLLGGYEEGRAAERFRVEQRRREAEESFIPEEDEDTSDEEELASAPPEEESPEEARSAFERLVRERFIYGLLDSDLYATVDWDDKWDEDTSRDDEDRWFEDEDES